MKFNLDGDVWILTGVGKAARTYFLDQTIWTRIKVAQRWHGCRAIVCGFGPASRQPDNDVTGHHPQDPWPPGYLLFAAVFIRNIRCSYEYITVDGARLAPVSPWNMNPRAPGKCPAIMHMFVTERVNSQPHVIRLNITLPDTVCLPLQTMSSSHANSHAYLRRGRNTLGTRLCCEVESTSMTLIQRRNNVVCPVG